jgi:hypothetical protein
LRSSAAIAAMVVTACAPPSVLFVGHTEDRTRAFEVVKQGDLQWVVVDGKRQAAHAEVAAWAMVSSGARIAYAARRGKRWVIEGDYRDKHAWDGIGDIAVAGDHLAYAALDGTAWRVVVDGTASGAYIAVLAHTLSIDDRGRAIYAATDALGAAVYTASAGAPPASSPAFSGVGQLAVTAGHVVYTGRRGDQVRAIIDGVAGPAVTDIAFLTPTAYAAREADGWHVVRVAAPADVDRGAAADAAHVVDAAAHADILALVARGDHVAYVARDGDRDAVYCDTDLPIAPTSPHVRALAIGATGCASLVFITDEPATASIGTLAQPADGSHLAYVQHTTGDRDVIVVDQTVVSPPFDQILDGTLAFSRDATRIAAIAGDRTRESLAIVVYDLASHRELRRTPVALRELVAAAAAHVTDLRPWCAAEAELAAISSVK